MDILNSIPDLSEEVLIETIKLKPEDMEKIHKSFTLDNPMTFKVFLSKRPDLPEEEKEIYFKIIEKLERNERIRYQTAMKDMITANYGVEPMEIEPPEVIIQTP